MTTGESVSIQLFDGNETVLRGPATITMISQHTFPPVPMPVQVIKFDSIISLPLSLSSSALSKFKVQS